MSLMDKLSDKKELAHNFAFLVYTFCLTLVGHQVSLQILPGPSGCSVENIIEDIIVSLVAFAFKGYEWRSQNYEWTQVSKVHKLFDKSWMQCFNKMIIYFFLFIVYMIGSNVSSECIFDNAFVTIISLLSNMMMAAMFGLMLCTYDGCCYKCMKKDDEKLLNSKL